MSEGLLITFWATKARITTSRIGKAALLKKRLTGKNQRTRADFGRPSTASRSDGHVGEVAVALGVVEAVADREAVGDLEADVAGREVDAQALRLGQQGADLQRGRIARLQVAHQVLQGEAGVDDVLDDQHVAVFDRRIEVLEDAHHARGVGLRAVAGDRHEVDLAGDVDAAHQVGEKEDRALEHADHEEVTPGVLLADLAAELGDPPLQVLAGDEGLADPGVGHRAAV